MGTVASGKSRLVRFQFARGATAKEIAEAINKLRAERTAPRTEPK